MAVDSDEDVVLAVDVDLAEVTAGAEVWAVVKASAGLFPLMESRLYPFRMKLEL